MTQINNNNNINQTQTNNNEARAEAKAKAEAKNEISIQIGEVAGTTELIAEDIDDEFELLADQLGEHEVKATQKQTNRAIEAIKQIEQAHNAGTDIPVKAKSRWKGFIEDLSDEDSTLRKSLKLLRRGKNYAVNLAEKYNGFATDLGLNPIPGLALSALKAL